MPRPSRRRRTKTASLLSHSWYIVVPCRFRQCCVWRSFQQFPPSFWCLVFWCSLFFFSVCLVCVDARHLSSLCPPSSLTRPLVLRLSRILPSSPQRHLPSAAWHVNAPDHHCPHWTTCDVRTTVTSPLSVCWPRADRWSVDFRRLELVCCVCVRTLGERRG